MENKSKIASKIHLLYLCHSARAITLSCIVARYRQVNPYCYNKSTHRIARIINNVTWIPTG